MPQFVDDTDKKPLTGSNRATDSMSQDGTAWMSDTDLEVTFRGNVPFISIKLQSDKVCKVVRGSYERGQRMFAFGLEEDADLTVDNVFAMVTPFATRGTDILAYEALVESADHEGYFGEDDMAERLLNDSWSQYAKPLIDYVSFVPCTRSYVLHSFVCFRLHTAFTSAALNLRRQSVKPS